MRYNYKRWNLYSPSINNSYGQPTKGLLKSTADISILPYVPTANEADVRFSTSTHFGLTAAEGIESGDYISDGVLNYIVEYQINITRYKQLYLREVVL